MPPSSPLLRSLQQIQLQRRALVRRLSKVPEVAVGSVSVVPRKCGKPGCHCAQGGGHPQTLFLFQAEDGKRHCKLVRQADADRLLRAGNHYRQFRANLRKLRAINQREEQILVRLLQQKAVHYE